MFLTSKLNDFSRCFVDFFYIFVTFSFRCVLYCSGDSLYILLLLLENRKTSGEEFTLEISCFIFFWKSSVDLLCFRELTILYNFFSNASNSLHLMFGLETVYSFNRPVAGVISIILEKVCFPVQLFNKPFNFVNYQ